MNIEIVEDLRDRGRIIPLNQLDHVMQFADGELYRSLFAFGDEVIEYVEKNGSISKFDGVVNFDKITLDVDGENQSVIDKVDDVLKVLETQGVSPDSFQIYFSGRGFHIELHPSLFAVEPSIDAHLKLRSIISQYFKNVDMIYDKTRLIRVINTVNKKSNLYKIPLSFEEFDSFDFDYIKNLAKKPRFDYKVNLKPGARIFRYIETENESTTVKTERRLRTNKFLCIHDILDNDPPVGQRHNHVLRLASHFHRQGYNKEVAKGSIMGWINDSKENKDIDKTVNDVYGWSSFYSCKDPLLLKYCDKSCIFYTDAPVADIENMEASYIERLRGNIIKLDLKGIFDLEQPFDILGGELVTVLGATGMGKTAFVQNITANITIPTMYFSLEMPAHQMYRRFIQTITGFSKDDVAKIKRRKYNQRLNHINLTSKAIYANEIPKFIEAYGSKIIIVDHIALLKSQFSDEYQKITEVTSVLKQVCLEYDVIIFAVSQVSRDNAKDKQGLTVHSGKGSGSIENDSDKVIAFTKTDRMDTRARIYSTKDREGQVLDTSLNMINFKLSK